MNTARAAPSAARRDPPPTGGAARPWGRGPQVSMAGLLGARLARLWAGPCSTDSSADVAILRVPALPGRSQHHIFAVRPQVRDRTGHGVDDDGLDPTGLDGPALGRAPQAMPKGWCMVRLLSCRGRGSDRRTVRGAGPWIKPCRALVTMGAERAGVNGSVRRLSSAARGATAPRHPLPPPADSSVIAFDRTAEQLLPIAQVIREATSDNKVRSCVTSCRPSPSRAARS